MYHLNTILRDVINTQRRYIDVHNNFINSNIAYTNNIDHYMRMYNVSYDINVLLSNNRTRQRSRDQMGHSQRGLSRRSRQSQQYENNESRETTRIGNNSERINELNTHFLPPIISRTSINNSDNRLTQNIEGAIRESIDYIERDPLCVPVSIVNEECEIIPFSSIENNTQTICPIALSPFNENENVMRIHFCGHIFNENLLRENFRHRPTCPVCRHNIITTVYSSGFI